MEGVDSSPMAGPTLDVTHKPAPPRDASSSSRSKAEEKVNMTYVNQSIEAAKAVSSFAKTAMQLDTTGHLASEPRTAPGALGFLTYPEAAQEHTHPTTAGGEMLLPGATESFEEQKKSAVSQLPAHLQPIPLSALLAEDSEDANRKPMPMAAVVQDLPQLAMQDYPFYRQGSQEGSPFQADDEELGSDDRSVLSSEGDSTSGWPPKPPLLKFKMRMQFSTRFKPGDPREKEMLARVNQEINDGKVMMRNAGKDIQDPTIGWLNLVFGMAISDSFQIECGFPVIVLTMLDAIYKGRVSWHEVDFKVQYKKAAVKNYALLNKIWDKVNMNISKEFRVENTHLRLEQMPTAAFDKKMEFLRLMKRWYDVRCRVESDPYNPQERRTEFIEQSRLKGHYIDLPCWMKWDSHLAAEQSEQRAQATPRRMSKLYNAMPEYKRLIWFLGSTEHQTM